MRKTYINNPIVAYYNINSLRNKIHDIREIILKFLPDLLVLAETKIDKNFPIQQFLINEYNEPTRKDRSEFGGGIIEYTRKGVIRKRIKNFEMKNFESICSEINIENVKWFLLSVYRSPNYKNIKTFFAELNTIVNQATSKYDNIIVMGDMNIDIDDPCTHGYQQLTDFMNAFDLTNLIKAKTCITWNHESSIDLILSNRPRSHMHSNAYELGISDFHKVSLTFLKSHIARLKPCKISYRCYKNFIEEDFLFDLRNNFSKNLDFENGSKSSSNDLYDSLVNTLTLTINTHAPVKSKYIRGNQASFMNRELSKAIMYRSKLKSKYRGNKTPENREKYKAQRNKCVYIRREAIKKKFSNTISCGVISSKDFYKLVKPYLSEKGALTNNDITLVDDDEIVTDRKRIVEIFNKYYVNIVKIATGKSPISIKDNEENRNCTNEEIVLKIINFYKNHPSILAIKRNFKRVDSFSFKRVSEENVLRQLENLDVKKSIGEDDIPPKILKLSRNVLCKPLTIAINSSIRNNCFPDRAKRAAITPIFKSEDKTDKSNYRPVSILNTLSKIFENVMKEQLVPFFEKCLSTFVSAYRKKYSTHHVLMRLIENWKKNLDESKLVGIIFMDLSKAFDCIPHDLLIAKLEAYGLSQDALAFIYSYLKGRKQSVRISSIMSIFLEILSGVPQGSILGAILFNTFINDLFLFIKNASLHNYADDNSLETFARELDELVELLSNEANTAVEWLEENNMIPNPKKFQAIVSCKNKSTDTLGIPIQIKEQIIYSKESVLFLGITLDQKLKFDQHISNLCKKAASQLNALYRIKRYLTVEIKTILVNSFIYSNFNYCPHVWHI